MTVESGTGSKPQARASQAIKVRQPRMEGGLRVGVTGGAGFIGSHTVEMLVAVGASVLVIDDFSHSCGASLPDEVEVVSADCGSEAASRALATFKPDVVLHLASKGGVQKAGGDPGEHVKTSLASSVGLFDSAIKAGARRIVTASSGGTVYGDRAELPARETHQPAPLSAYGAAKRSEEIYVATLGRRHGTSTLALRYGNVYGPRQDGTGEAGVVAITCCRLLEGSAPRIYGDGEQTRDFVYVSDVATANVSAVSSRLTGEVNIATGRETSVNSIVDRLTTESGRRIRTEFEPARPFEVRSVCLSPARARRNLSWVATVSTSSGLKQTWSWFCKHHFAQQAPPLRASVG
jgi:UDP-glucose 4-epimerase